MKKFVAIGECMLELRPLQDNTFALGFAGDTLNVALYLARYQQQIPATVDYITAVGDDPYSTMMLQSWQQEGIGTHWVAQFPHALPGLYFIHNDAKGERFLYYYRAQSAARRLFYADNIAQISAQLLQYNEIYFSGISLAILDVASRQKLIALLQQAKKAGAHISFDNNYRPLLWENKTIAQQTIQTILPLVDIALMSFADEQQLWGDANPQASLERIKNYNINEIVIKQSEQGCLISNAAQTQFLAAPKIDKIVDATAAGDSFNAAYLAARFKGLSPIEAAQCGQKLAGVVIAHKGAIIPKEVMPKIF